jgi:molybdopterin-containing oxidoreductase family iron-sulfur binding subunit
MLGVNPAFQTPATHHVGMLLEKLETTVHLGTYVDETAKISRFHIPLSHFLESWGDWWSMDGVVSVQQPLIQPLYRSMSELEFMLVLQGVTESAYDFVKRTFDVGRTRSELKWHNALHAGVIETRRWPSFSRFSYKAVSNQVKGRLAFGPLSAGNYELNFYLDNKVYDGRYANNSWLQELPDPISKLTWDNAFSISPAMAKRMSLKMGDVINVNAGDHSVRGPVNIVPGVADYTLAISFGYGRMGAGRVQKNVGFNAYQLQSMNGSFSLRGVTVEKTNRFIQLASTQDHGAMEGRPIVRSGTIEQYRKNPKFAEVHHPPLKSIFERSNSKKGQQWGMSIDLASCTGCSACVVACHAENNIPVVGKDRVLEGREMHWLRVDRYFTGSPDDPGAVSQPLPCMHCENAPCETVCPVAATTHSPEGLNDMAYNRCIGTRYCANNCPYKVRRFNYFNFTKHYTDTEKMSQNPDVTVRFRGVMEKCSFCVQRINREKISAKNRGQSRVEDNKIVTACAQACPSDAIVFGDITDPSSRVSKLKRQGRDYALLSELNNIPRTTYLARLNNPNPELV